MKGDSLGDRMKSFYEDAYRIKLTERSPVIIRLDGKSFHTYTKGCSKPFDDKLIECMNETAKYLCKNVQNTTLAYVQSDEISLLLNNYKGLYTESWCQNNLQKIVSLSAALASSYLTSISMKIFGNVKLAAFDSRAFTIPKEEVCNLFIWRQQDCIRNSVQMLARSVFSDKECHKVNCDELKQKLLARNIDWNSLDSGKKFGRCIVKQQYLKENTMRSSWEVEKETPIFSQNREFVNKLVFTGENE